MSSEADIQDDIEYFERKLKGALGIDKCTDEQVASVTHEMRATDRWYRVRLGLLRKALWVYVKARYLKRPMGRV